MKQVGFAAAHWGMLLWAALVASSFYAAAEVTTAIDPVLLTALRLLISATLFLPLLLLKGEARLTQGALLGHAGLGFLLAVYFASLFLALRHTSALNTALLYALVPLMTLGFEVVLLPSNDGKKRLLPMTTAAAGAILLIAGNSTKTVLPDAYPVLLYGVGCLAMALYSPLSQHLKGSVLQGRSPVGMTFWNMLFGALFLFAFTAFSGGWRSASTLSIGDLAWLGYLALFTTLGTFWLLHRAVGVIAPATVISYIYLSTLFATLVHWLWHGQQPAPLGVAGAVLVGLGMLGLVMISRQALATSAWRAGSR